MTCAFIVWLGDTPKPFTLSNGVVENQPVYPGQLVKADWMQNYTELCKATSTREIVLPSKHVDTFEPVAIDPPEKVGTKSAVGEAVLSPVATEGVGIYRSKVTVPAQFSKSCIRMFASSFMTPDVPFRIAVR